jgi:uncharacterized protein (DUF697 family)/GTP-binding protein EngB required for normal cell division
MIATEQDAFDHAVRDAIESATRGLGKVNVLIAGKTGVGKSTLINAIFRGDLAKTGSGKPITQNTSEITKPGHPLTIIDTKGLEVADYESAKATLESLIETRSADDDQNKHIHVAWICIHESGKRVENAEIELCDLLVRHKIPVIVVLTKARKNDPFSKEVKTLIPQATDVVAVRALPEYIQEADITLDPFGLDTLIETTATLIPEAQKRAYANALSTRNKKALAVKKRQAEIEVNAAASLAATAAAVPLPFSDALTLVPIQVAMFAKVGVTFGMEMSTATLTTLVTSALGASAATVVGRTIASGLLKLIPGAGSAVGGTVAATTAGTITKLLGNAYISVLNDFCEKNPGKDIDIALITSELKRRMRLKSDQKS